MLFKIVLAGVQHVTLQEKVLIDFDTLFPTVRLPYAQIHKAYFMIINA